MIQILFVLHLFASECDAEWEAGDAAAPPHPAVHQVSAAV